MNIQPISNFKQITFTSKATASSYVSKPITLDVFEASEAVFDLDKSIKTLSDVRLENGKKKFEKNQLIKIETSLKQEPKKWDAVYKLANNPNIKGDFVYLMASKPLNQLNMLAEISDLKNEKGDFKYSGKEMMQFTDKLMPNELQKIIPLTKTKLPVKNIVSLAYIQDLPRMEEVANKVLEMEKLVGKDLDEISFTQDKYAKNEYVITVKMLNEKTKRAFLDKDLKRQAVEDSTSFIDKNGEKHFVKRTADYRNNTVSKVTLRYDSKDEIPVFENEVRIVKDKNNKVKYYEYTSNSEVDGVYDVVRQSPDGKKEVLSSGKLDKKTGEILIKKDMTSPEGVRTQYSYKSDANGNRAVEYKITDKSGKVLLNKNQTKTVVSENKIITTNGNDKYEINVADNEISVQSLQDKNRKAKFTEKDNFLGDKKVLLSILKQLAGEELLKLSDSIDFLETTANPLDSYSNGSCRSITTGDNEFLFLHELGHARDYRDVEDSNNYDVAMKKSLTMDKDVNRVFEDEKTAFFKAYPETQRDFMEYFLDVLTHGGGETGGLSETIAESNALLSEGKSYKPIAIRSQYLQQNFPRTIALLETKLNS